jgi:hypothetical protein
MQKRCFTASPAMVVSLIALFVALGGTSYAAIMLPANSVGTKQIKNGAVTAAKISSSSVGTVKVVGGAGAPAYQGAWGPSGAGDEGVSFSKDAFGIVHFQGSATTSAFAVRKAKPRTHGGRLITNDTLFTLPVGYRPAGILWFAAYGGNGTAAYIEITSSGAVNQIFSSATYIGLGNITFRAAK